MERVKTCSGYFSASELFCNI